MLELPNKADKLLLHCCCAPCAGGIILRLLKAKINFTIFFYNPNIHPKEEYNLRKQELMRFAAKHKIPFVDADYDPDNWHEIVRGLEDEPERGERCSKCFFMRLRKTAAYALEHGFPVFSTTLGISRWKDFDQVTKCGRDAQIGRLYWDINWRKQGGNEYNDKITREENFYRQKYCGCVYSY